MKKTRMFSTMAAAIAVVCVVPATPTNLPAHLAMFSMGDSPISVADGSIHGYVRGLNFRFWKSKTDGQVYTVEAPDVDYITFSGFTDSNGAAPPSPLTNTGGWLILISNGDMHGGNINPNSIAYCSTAQETPSPSCILGTPNNSKWVYLETHPDAGSGAYRGRGHGTWGPTSLNKTLEFHDTRPGCENGVCDHIVSITIKTVYSQGPPRPDGQPTVLPGPNDGHTYYCNAIDKCAIAVGGVDTEYQAVQMKRDHPLT